MYQENQFKTFNIWRDQDVIHVFLSVPSKKYNQFTKTIYYVKKILGLNFDIEYDGSQIYFLLTDFDEYKEFKAYFYRYLCCFKEEH